MRTELEGCTRVLLLILVGCSCVGWAEKAFGQADPLSNWQWRNPLPQGTFLNAVGYGNGIFVAVGDASGEGSTVLTSRDGNQWVKRDFKGFGGRLNAVTYANGVFMAVGDGSLIGTSSNGVDWLSQTIEPAVFLYSVTFGNGVFVAVGGAFPNAWAFTSSNGLDWAGQIVEEAYPLNAVTYANGIFVAVGRDYQFALDTQEARVMTSEDGLNWTRRATNLNSISEMEAVTYGKGQFVGVGQNYPFEEPLILTSTNGIDWEEQYFDGYTALFGVVFGDRQFVAIGGHWDDFSQGWIPDLVTSSDGVEWHLEAAPPIIGTPSGVAWGAGTYAAVGAFGQIISSSDGLSWTNHLHGFYGHDWDLNAITANSNITVAVGGNRDLGRGGILSSTNGLDWTRTAYQISPGQDVVSGQDAFVAIGGSEIYGSQIYFSGDGLTWTHVESGYPLKAITYGKGTFVAVGGWCSSDNDAASWIETSGDGQTWRVNDAGTNGILKAIAYGNGVFVAAGGGDDGDGNCVFNGPPIISSDGAHWTPLDGQMFLTPATNGYVSDSRALDALAFGNGRFVGATYHGDIWTSFDGSNWVYQTHLWSAAQPDADLTKLIYVNHTFIALSFGPLFTSPDGVNWTPHTSAVFTGLTYAYGSYFGVGFGGAILQSDPAPPENTSFDFALKLLDSPELVLRGGSNRAFRIDYRDDLRPTSSWQALTNLYPTSSPFSWQDAESPRSHQRFYRATMLP